MESLIQLTKKASTFPNQLIVIIIKGRYSFITHLQGLDLSDCVSALLLNSVNADRLPLELAGHFDFIGLFNAGEYWDNDSVAHLDHLQFPELVECVDHLMTRLQRSGPNFDMKRVRLVAMEEHFVRATADLRQRYNIEGPKPDDIRPFTDKAYMKRVATEGGLATAKYVVLSPLDMKQNEEHIRNLETSVGYPIICKPVHGSGSAGIEKVANRSQLTKWINEHTQADMPYLLEEYLYGDEYRSLVLIQESNVQMFSTPMMFYGRNNLVCIQNNIAMCACGEWDPRKRVIVNEFAQDTARIFGLPAGGLLFVQSIMTSSGEMKLIELANRVPGMIGCTVFCENSGISPESVHIMAQIRPVDFKELEVLGKKRKKCFASLTYPMKQGTVKIVKSVPKEMLKSEVAVRNCVKAGDTTAMAGNIADMAVRMYLWNDDDDTLKRDCQWLRENFQPLVMENGC